FGLHFVFLDSETNDIANTLSIQNQARDFPSYRIVNGHTHDWLVVTRMGSWGTGLQYDYDEWYILSYSGNMKMVLSYKSGGNEVFLDGSTNKYWRTEILNDGYADDSAVDVKFIEKICSTTEDGGDKECSETSKITHYIWNESKEEFILKNTIK
ncbi:MAG: hypothetical protein NT094_01335, partial [Candidatus Staskawiczbacteria bacterium]|nr:hypothetical protein [Candidatus Staskawiczbacteria bacterium]